MLVHRAAFVVIALATSASAAAPQRPAALRYRVIGVYDARTGDAVEGVEIADLTTGIKAMTTKTGTIGLVLADTIGTLVRIRKFGYVPSLVSVATGMRDTIPLTLTLDPVQELPAVVTRARGNARTAADTVRRLELNGFYERRETTGAPSAAFLTEKQIDRLSLVSDASALSGRPICSTNLYLNGVRVNGLDATKLMGKGHLPRNLKSAPVDQMVSPGEVLAMEFYKTADAPAEYNATRPPDVPDCGVTLIWTK
jgi:hypothetical protein